jgi:aminoglycoside 6-adenylyltransferase
MAAAIDPLIERFLAFARTRPDIRAAVVVGSHARTDHPADEWADLDLLVFTTDPERYLSSGDWTSEVGSVWSRCRHHRIANEKEWLVVFEGGVDVDFVFSSYTRLQWGLPALGLLRRFPRLLALLPTSAREQLEGTISLGARVFGRGTRVLLDPTGLVGRMQRALGAPPSVPMPTEDEFLGLVHHLLCLAMKIAKKVRRGELYVARASCEFAHVTTVLPMIEWHARATRGWDYETWHDGRFLEEWADPRVVAALPEVFPRYAADDVPRALLATLDLFHWTAAEVAGRLGYAYPTLADERIRAWIGATLVRP